MRWLLRALQLSHFFLDEHGIEITAVILIILYTYMHTHTYTYMYTHMHMVRTVNITRGYTEKDAKCVDPLLTPFPFPKGRQCDKVVLLPTRSILGVFSRPLISLSYRFQDPPRVPKPRNAQVPWSALRIFGSASADPLTVGHVTLFVFTGKNLCRRELVPLLRGQLYQGAYLIRFLRQTPAFGVHSSPAFLCSLTFVLEICRHT